MAIRGLRYLNFDTREIEITNRVHKVIVLRINSINCKQNITLLRDDHAAGS